MNNKDDSKAFIEWRKTRNISGYDAEDIWHSAIEYARETAPKPESFAGGLSDKELEDLRDDYADMKCGEEVVSACNELIKRRKLTVPVAVVEAAKWLLTFREGELPVRGWLRDNDMSRKALDDLARATAQEII